MSLENANRKSYLASQAAAIVAVQPNSNCHPFSLFVFCVRACVCVCVCVYVCFKSFIGLLV